MSRSIAQVLAPSLFLIAFAGCSLGTGVTPECNLDGSDPKCDPAPACDDGKGGLVRSEACCLERANDQYNLQCGVENAAGKDYRPLCGASAMGNAACCNAASGTYATCLGK
ncbi:MAG: hypothetical protein FJ096_19395 [Deltaproteobacteria bacterium]|nr:hypothetical protein [Deltaproteobacteria bacterium]